MEDEALLRQEVDELTAFVRHDPDWAGLRDAIVGEGLAIDDVFLAGFYESEFGHEFGGVVTTAGQMFEFQRSSDRRSRGFMIWKRIETAEAFSNSFAAGSIALKMATGRPRD